MSVYFLSPTTGNDVPLAVGPSTVDQVSGNRPLSAADAVIYGQGTYALGDAGGHTIQPRRESAPGQDSTMGLPEPGIWVMLLIGFVGWCAVVFRRGRKDRLASAFAEDH